MSGLLGLGATTWLVIFSFLFVLAVLWFLLPFAVFGSKSRLDKIVNELRELNRTMKGASEQNRVLIEQQKLLRLHVSRALPKSRSEIGNP